MAFQIFLEAKPVKDQFFLISEEVADTLEKQSTGRHIFAPHGGVQRSKAGARSEVALLTPASWEPVSMSCGCCRAVWEGVGP